MKKISSIDDKIQFVRQNTKTEHRENQTVDPRRVRTVSGLFIPKSKKVYRNGKREGPFSPSGDIVH